jgi:hypothetical protein
MVRKKSTNKLRNVFRSSVSVNTVESLLSDIGNVKHLYKITVLK